MLLLRSTTRYTSLRSTSFARRLISTSATARKMNGDLNNTSAAREAVTFEPDPAYDGRSFAIPLTEDDEHVRAIYRPFLLDDTVSSSDWVARLELSTALKMVDEEIFAKGQERLKVLVLYGSMRARYVVFHEGLNESM